MKLFDIIKKVGGGIIREAVPGGDAIISVINGFLPEDKKLGENATGSQIEEMLDKLPPTQQVALYSKQFDVQIEQIKEEHASIRAMLQAEAHSKHTTRPYIAKGSFYVYSICTLIIVATIGYAVYQTEDPLLALNNSSMLLLSVMGPYPVILYAYFGMLKKEHENRLNAANGKQAGIGALSGIFNAFKK